MSNLNNGKRDSGPPTISIPFVKPRSLLSSLHAILVYCLFKEPKYMFLLVWHSLVQIPALVLHRHRSIKKLKTRLVRHASSSSSKNLKKLNTKMSQKYLHDEGIEDDFHSAVVIKVLDAEPKKKKLSDFFPSSSSSEEEEHHLNRMQRHIHHKRQEWPWLMTFITGIIRGSAVARIHQIPRARSMTSALLTDLILDKECSILPTRFHVDRNVLLEKERTGDFSSLGDYVIPPETSPDNNYSLDGEWIGRKQDLNNLFMNSSSSSSSSSPTQRQRVILFVHGGALFAGNPKTHRNLTWRYAKETGSVVFAINYRKCPEHPFPASLHDVFAAYLYLTQPNHAAISSSSSTTKTDPTPLHPPIHPSNISIVGDSAGAGIAMSFLLYLKHVLRAQDMRSEQLSSESCASTDLMMPASSVLLSPWVDLTCCKRSWVTNRSTDFVPTMNFFEGMFDEGSPVLWYSMGIKDSERDAQTNYLAMRTWFKPEVDKEYLAKGLLAAHVQANLILRHPLISPMWFKTPSEMPPILILNGDSEVLRDEAIHLFKTLHRYNNNSSEDSQAKIQHLMYANMPHIFQLFDGILEMQCFQHKIVNQRQSQFELLHFTKENSSSYARVNEFFQMFS